ncbi:hypothetical protein ACOMHN_015032 [Nucella lapillus]
MIQSLPQISSAELFYHESYTGRKKNPNLSHHVEVGQGLSNPYVNDCLPHLPESLTLASDTHRLPDENRPFSGDYAKVPGNKTAAAGHLADAEFSEAGIEQSTGSLCEAGAHFARAPSIRYCGSKEEDKPAPSIFDSVSMTLSSIRQDDCVIDGPCARVVRACVTATTLCLFVLAVGKRHGSLCSTHR